MQYLWQRDRESLLNEMLENGLHAVLLKVSGGGLDPEKHVGKDLHTMKPTFHRLRDHFGLDICGEGGEYETLVLDCPKLFSRRLELLESEIIVDLENPSVGYLGIKSFQTTPKVPPEVALGVPKIVGQAISNDTLSKIPAEREHRVAIERLALPKSSLHLELDGFGSTNLIVPMPIYASTDNDIGMNLLRNKLTLL